MNRKTASLPRATQCSDPNVEAKYHSPIMTYSNAIKNGSSMKPPDKRYVGDMTEDDRVEGKYNPLS